MAFRSGITRAFDLGDSGNRFVLGWTPLVGVLAGVVTLAIGDGWTVAFRNGFGAGGAAFLAWAITRELHPDRRGVAVAAAIIAPLGLLRSSPDLLAAAVVLLVVRIVAGTTGRWLRWFDVGLMAAVAIPVAWRATGAGVLTVSAIALAATTSAQTPSSRARSGSGSGSGRRLAEYVSATVLLAGAAVGAVLRTEFGYEVDPWFIVPAVAGLGSLRGPARVVVGTDRAGGVITSQRVRAARLVALLAAMTAGAGGAPAAAVAPVWAALTAVGLRPR